MQPVNAFGAPIVVIVDPATVYSDRQQRYINIRSDLAQKLIIFGSLQIVFGILCIVFDITTLIYVSTGGRYTVGSLGQGIWCGVMFIITGTIGIIGGKRKIIGYVRALNVLSILSALLAGVMLSLAIGLTLSSNYLFEVYAEYSFKSVVVAMQSTIAILGLVEGIVAILSSVVCCKIGVCECDDNCCCPPSFEPMRINNQQLMMITNQQPTMTTTQQPMTITHQVPMMTVNQQPMPYPYSYAMQQPSTGPYGHMGKGYYNSEYSYA